jgi:hypothetical protein
VITYRATLPIAPDVVAHLATLLAVERGRRGTRRGRRALSCGRQAVLVLRWFLDATRLAQLADDHQVSLSTAYRYLHEGIDALATTAPDLHEALATAREQGAPHLILDGTSSPPTGSVCTPNAVTTSGTPANIAAMAGTFRSWPARTGGRSGSRQ